MVVSSLLATLVLAASPSDAIDRVVRAEMAASGTPGIAVGIFRRGQGPIYKTYGFANVEHRAPVTRETVFQSGSVGKQFTAALVLLLAQEGKLSLDDPLPKFFPEAKGTWDGVTVRHLLHHTSGLPNIPYGLMDMRRDYSEAQLVDMLQKGVPMEKPGATFRYNNGGYVLLGALVRRVTGRFYGDELKDRIFRPLGMTTARIIDEAEIVPHRAAGYEFRRDEKGRAVPKTLRNQEWVSPMLNTTADGALYLTLDDMRKWDAGLRGDRLFTPATRQIMTTSGRLNDGTVTGYACGWGVGDAQGSPIMAHTGAWQGFVSYIGRLPNEGVTVVVFANHAGFNVGKIGNQALAISRPKPKSR